MDRVAGDFEYDEFIRGDLYHCASIVKNNKILHVQVSRYLYPWFDFSKGRPIASIVVLSDDPMHERVRNFNEIILNGLKTIPNCVTHHEIFKTEDDRFIFVEITARPSGAFICPAYELNIGLDLKLVHYQLQIGLDFNLVIKQGVYTAWAMFPKNQEKSYD